MIQAISSNVSELGLPISRRLLTRLATLYGSRLLLVDGNVRRTYTEVAQIVGSRARRLIEAGVGGRVTVALPSSVEFVYTVLALFEAGAVPVLVNPALTRRERDAIRDDCGSRWVVEPSGSGSVARLLASATSMVEVQLGTSPTTHDPLPTPDTSNDQDSEALMLYTSGSTGRMKGVVHTVGSILRNICRVAATLGISTDDRYLTTVPLIHSFGFSFGLLSAMVSGATVVSPEHLGAVGLLEQVERQSITVLVCTSSLLGQLVTIARAERPALHSLRRVVVAGAPLRPSSAEEAMATICPNILNLYGMTELGGIAVVRQDDPRDRRFTTVGRPVLGVEVRVVDADRRPLPCRSVGEIACSTDGMFREYLNMPDLTQRLKDAAGWFYTGDVGYLDEEGYLTLVGRKDDLIIKQGFNVYPKEVDLVLSFHPAVAECAVVGVADGRRGERIRAVVSLQPGSVVSERALRRLCAERLVYYKVPDEILFVESLPRAPSGKVDVPLLRTVAWSPTGMSR